MVVSDHLGYGDQIHGASRLYRLWAKHLDPERYELTICILRKKSHLSRPFEEDGTRLAFLGKSKYDPTALIGLLRLVRREKPDLLHVQTYESTTLGRLVRAITGVPVLVHFHDTNPWYPLVQRIADRLLGRFTDGYLAVSNSARDCWAPRCGVDPASVAVLQNCVSLEEFAPADPSEVARQRSALGIDPAWRVVGTVARLFEGKGVRYLLEAAPMVLQSFPNTLFLIVGDGPMRRELESLSDRLGIRERVVFLGFVEKVASVVCTFDLEVLTSSAEGSPLTVLEAMAMARPIVATTVFEIIEDGVTGLLVPPRNPELLAEKIVYLLGQGEVAARLAQNARAVAEAHDVRHYVRKLEKIYDSLLATRRNGRES